MIIVLKPNAPPEVRDELSARIAACGLRPLVLPGSERVVMGALGDERVLAALHLEAHPHVESVKPILSAYKLVGRELHPHDTVVALGSSSIGGHAFAVLAGPAVIDDLDQLLAIARRIRAAGGTALHGAVHPARPSPYAGRGLGASALPLARQVAREVGLALVTEVHDVAELEAALPHVDGVHLAGAQMQSARLLEALGRSGVPVLIERGPAARMEELLMAAEHVVAAGNGRVVLVEAGLRTFETATRSTIDLGAVAWLEERTHLPVIVDPSRGSGQRELVAPLTRAALAAGADGVRVEVHPDPARASGDGRAALDLDAFEALLGGLVPLAGALGRGLGGRS